MPDLLPDPPATTIVVCLTCGPADDKGAGTRLHDAASAIADGPRVRGVKCLANCKRSCSAAIAHDGAWTYVFGDLTPDDAPSLLQGAALLAGSADGLMPWRGRPDCLKRGLVARVPPMPLLGDVR